MTSDDWVELASEPISIEGSRSPQVVLRMSSTAVDLDALEVVAVPDAFRPISACSGTESAACGEGRFCIHGYCQDGNAMVPTLPSEASRDRVVEVLSQKLNVFFGGVASRQAPMQQAFQTLDEIRHASNAWAFWNGFARAVVELSDAHTRPFGLFNYVSRGGRAFPVCLVEGEGDLSHLLAPADDVYADILVSHVGPEKNLGLKPGDRIVAVDGQHPLAWAQNLVGYSWDLGRANDPLMHGLTVELLIRTIPAHATTLDVIRCEGTSCSGVETIEASTFAEDSEDTIHPTCDHRPAYHLAQSNPDAVTHDSDGVFFGPLEDSGVDESLYGMIWNDTAWWEGIQNPWQSAYTTFRNDAKGLILDHRMGNGGSPAGAAYLTELSHSTRTASVWSLNTTLGLFDTPLSEVDGLALFNKWKTDSSRSWKSGSSAPREDMRIAVLLARDVSGSDFFPFGVKGSPNTKLFGRRTMGAFSTYMMFETATFFAWTLASGDFIDPQGIAHIGTGVVPDEEVVPKQSDLLLGKDTAYERALAWVRCGDGGCE